MSGFLGQTAQTCEEYYPIVELAIFAFHSFEARLGLVYIRCQVETP